MIRTFKTLIVVVGIFSFDQVFASETKQMNIQMKNLISMQKTQLEAMLEMMEDPKILKAQARYFKKLYDALIAEGFNKEQAIKIVSASASK